MYHSKLDQIIEDYTNALFAEHAADPGAHKGDIPYGPTFLMPVCWIALHEYACWGKEQQENVDFIEAHSWSISGDCPSNGYRLYEFDQDAQSIEAMQRMDAILGDGIYIRKKDDGRYIELDDQLKEELGLNSPHFKDWKDPDVLKDYITNFAQLYNQRFLGPKP